MSQSAYSPLVPLVDSGRSLSTNLNLVIPALYSSHSGDVQPPSPVVGQTWLDTSNAASFALKLYASTGIWATLFTITPSTGVLSIAATSPNIAILATLAGGHGMSVGSPVYYTGSTWEKALASGGNQRLAQALVTAVSGNDVELTIVGVKAGFSGLQPGASYFTAVNTAGTLQQSPQAGDGYYRQFIMLALSSTVALINVATGQPSSSNYVSLFPNSSNANVVRSGGASVIPMVIQAAAGQTAPLIRFIDSSGNTLSDFLAPSGGGGGGSTSQFPVGAYMAYAGTSAPAGWLMCDGGVIASGHTQLILLLGTNILPDLRGKALFGAGANSVNLGATTGAGTVTLSTANLAPHSHTNKRGRLSASTDGNKPNLLSQSDNAPLWVDTVASSVTGEGTPFSIMPPNVGVNWIIKHD